MSTTNWQKAPNDPRFGNLRPVPISVTTVPGGYVPRVPHKDDDDSDDEEFLSPPPPVAILGKEDSSVVDPEASFLAEFSEGYSFRNLIEFLRGTNMQGNWIFTKNAIRYEQPNADGTILNSVEIETRKLTRYEFNSSNGEIVVGTMISEIRGVARSIGKKDGVRIYKAPNDNTIFFQITNQNTNADSMENVSPVLLRVIERPKIEYPRYTRGEEDPNCTVQALSFGKICNAIGIVGCVSVYFYGYERGFMLKGIKENGTVGRIDSFGDCQNQEASAPTSAPALPSFISSLPTQETHVVKPTNAPQLRLIVKQDENMVKVRIKTIKALAKLNNLAPGGVIMMYMEAGLPLKLICQVGAYGTLRIILRSFRDG